VLIEEIEETPPTKQGCAYCSEPGSSKVCSLCREVSYCSKGCQQVHWKVHRKECTRKYEPKPKDPPKIENPCVRCGKQGILESSGSWYCSHDCCSGNVNDLTAKIKQLNAQRVEHEARQNREAKESEAAKEFSRIKDFIASSCSSPAPSVKPVEELRPQANDPNEHIRRLIESQNKRAGGAYEPPPRPEDEAAKRGGAEGSGGAGAPAAQPRHEHGAREAARAKEPKCPVLQKMEEHQEAIRNLEKAKQEHQRFTEWVQWAQGEIQKKKADEDDDGA